MEIESHGQVSSDRKPPPSRFALWLTGLVAIGAFLLFFHNYGLNILPRVRIAFAPELIKPFPGEKSFAYVYEFDRSEHDVWLEPEGWFTARSRAILTENGSVLRSHLFTREEVQQAGGDRWTHEPGRIVFASVDNTDPRTNGRKYELTFPILYGRKIGYVSAAIFAAALIALYVMNFRRAAAPSREIFPPATARWRWHLMGASALFLAGLYCNTGTLSPYAITNFGHVVKETGYTYNSDHPHFKVLFDFVNGADRKIWDHAIMLRRVLFPTLAWPLMRIGGFEIGGTVASLLFNLAGFIFFVRQLRHRVGQRGAVFAGWLLALYPGAAYWGGLPYPYALIFPASLVLMIGLMELPTAGRGKLVVISLGMGVAYLGYDLAAFYVPAAVLVLCWHRRPGSAVLAALLQILPLALWLLFLVHGLGQPLSNSNSATYGVIVNAYLHVKDVAAWMRFISFFPTVGLDLWFGANFIFIPALLLAIIGLNAVTSRIRLLPAEAALLLVGLGLFLFNNLAPDYYGLGWIMRGTWIARIYQPIFPALIVFAARWWQHLPPLTWGRRTILSAAIAGSFAGNALVVFGPILGNPLKISETAFYKFYNHTALHWVYELQLKDPGRRPLGFPKPQP